MKLDLVQTVVPLVIILAIQVALIALVERYGPAPKGYLVVPPVGAAALTWIAGVVLWPVAAFRVSAAASS